MYHLLLISHYLRRRMIPLFAALAVTLCTAMVIIVMSVMGGFLGLMKNGAHKLTGDVVIGNVQDDQPSSGFAHYDELVADLEKDPAVARATPVIQCFAKLAMPGKTAFIQVVGVDGKTVGDVLKFDPMWSSKDMADLSRSPEDMAFWNSFDLKRAGRDLRLPGSFAGDHAPGATVPAAVLGVEVNPDHVRDEHGQYDPRNAFVGRSIKLALSDPNGQYEPKTCTLPVVNELKSGFYEADKSRIYVPFGWLQEKLEMTAREASTGFDPVTGEGGEKVLKPARCTQVLVAGKPGVPLAEVQEAARKAVDALCARHPESPLVSSAYGGDITPWDRIPRIRGLLLAVENEKNMMTFLFGIIGLVAVMMVGITFYMIVLEKTRDIGILRAIGASRAGVLALFVRYGLIIGVIGACAGLLLATFVVTHLNNLQRALGYHLLSLIAAAALLVAVVVALTVFAALSGRKTGSGFERGMGTFFGSLLLGGVGLFHAFNPICAFRPEWLARLERVYCFKMWDPRYYYFDSIPDQINWHEALTVAGCAVAASVVGALIPALIAATLDPVEALRHE